MEGRSDDHSSLNNQLVDKIIIVTLFAAILASVGSQLRALFIGWSYPDLFQFILFGFIATLALTR